jgi:hypothetical protein
MTSALFTPSVDSPTTFFTESNPDDHSAAWTAQALVARRAALQPYNDALYTVVRDSLIARRKEIKSGLMAAVSRSSTRGGLNISLWAYPAARLLPQDPPLSAEAREDALASLCADGHQWLIGRVCSDFDSTPREYMWDGQQEPRPVPVHDVVRCTDFLHRIALFFGDGQYRVSFHETVWGDVSAGEGRAQLSTCQLVLHYHPKGIYGRVSECIREAKAKYATHVPQPGLVPWDIPYLWTGPPRTPPSSPHPPSPPPAPRKHGRIETGPHSPPGWSNCDY